MQPAGSIFRRSSARSIKNATPLPVDSLLPADPPKNTGFPVTISLTVCPMWTLYVSMNHAMICSFVPMSGPMMSVCGPTNGIISCMYRRLTASSSRIDNSRGFIVMPPFAPP